MIYRRFAPCPISQVAEGRENPPKSTGMNQMVDHLKHRICVTIWGFPARHGGTPKTLDGLFPGKSPSKMDDDWGYPYLWKAPYCICMSLCRTIIVCMDVLQLQSKNSRNVLKSHHKYVLPSPAQPSIPFYSNIFQTLNCDTARRAI